MTARDRLLQSLTMALDRSRRSKQYRRAIQQPAVGAPAGRIRTPGGNPVPVRGNITAGAVPVGDAIAVSQGVTSGLPDAVTQGQFEAAEKNLRTQIGRVANRRGLKEFSGDPNTATPPAYQDFDYQLLLRTDNNTFYYWLPSDGIVPSIWTLIPIGGAAIQDEGIALPPQPAINFVGAGVTASDDPTNSRTNVVIPGGGSGGGVAVTYAEISPEGGSTTAPPAGGYLDGHLWVHTGIERSWIYRAANSSWVSMGSKNFLNTPSATDTDAIEVGDTLTIELYSWYWDGVDWVKNYCCDEGPEDPPSSGQCGSSGPPKWNPNCPNAGFSPSQIWTCGCN